MSERPEYFAVCKKEIYGHTSFDIIFPYKRLKYQRINQVGTYLTMVGLNVKGLSGV